MDSSAEVEQAAVQLVSSLPEDTLCKVLANREVGDIYAARFVGMCSTPTDVSFVFGVFGAYWTHDGGKENLACLVLLSSSIFARRCIAFSARSCATMIPSS